DLDATQRPVHRERCRNDAERDRVRGSGRSRPPPIEAEVGPGRRTGEPDAAGGARERSLGTHLSSRDAVRRERKEGGKRVEVRWAESVRQLTGGMRSEAPRPYGYVIECG